ncbi:GNAT family N-acetyltransferase [Cellulomonas wangsupingiae]|uniref:GNAT family N-acetyltransferase n=1 Tax=Cellulomonas wangsupingiae TaxID=2968085 RepID=A0ABY5K3U6_9CELL|nr:GNAT family N-acetyltransferase [Cellulomonas wangsupingiae]MCC2333875.1 GNAT family N-acetyltransferase [Cellulomonas wangsupingiae]UUI65134.1 GNAT family N-acetyltransferase [Cellulomonas wangsupingiae]
MDLSPGEHAVYHRSRLAFGAATAAGLPGRFEAFELGGLRALLTNSPGLGFLNSVTGANARTVAALRDVVAVFTAAGAPLPAVVGTSGDLPSAERLSDLRAAPGPVRPIAVLDPRSRDERVVPSDHLQVRPAVGEDLATFFEVLSAGYAAPVDVDRFLVAEHSDPKVLRFMAWKEDRPVAAAAMSLHDDVAVLGGAATLPTHRSCGAQTALLHSRLAAAAAAGARGAVATAAPGSPSVRNLARNGFTVHLRRSWLLAPAEV